MCFSLCLYECVCLCDLFVSVYVICLSVCVCVMCFSVCVCVIHFLVCVMCFSVCVCVCACLICFLVGVCLCVWCACVWFYLFLLYTHMRCMSNVFAQTTTHCLSSNVHTYIIIHKHQNAFQEFPRFCCYSE